MKETSQICLQGVSHENIAQSSEDPRRLFFWFTTKCYDMLFSAHNLKLIGYGSSFEEHRQIIYHKTTLS